MSKKTAMAFISGGIAAGVVVAGVCVPLLMQAQRERDELKDTISNAFGSTVYANRGEARAEVVTVTNVVTIEERVAAPGAVSMDEAAQGEDRGERRREFGPRRNQGAMTEEERQRMREEFTRRVAEMDEHRRVASVEAKNQFAEALNLSDQQKAYFNSVVDGLNGTASDIVSEWVDYIRETGKFDGDTRIRFVHDITSALVDAYDAMDATLPENWRDSSGDLNLASLLDPDTLRPLSEVQREMGIRGIPVEFMFSAPPRNGRRSGTSQPAGNGADGGGFQPMPPQAD